MPSPVLKLGWAESVLPDAVGLDLTGFLNRENPSTGVREPLYARALWFDDGKKSVAWASVDLLAVPWSLVNRVSRRLGSGRGSALRALSICATHTHSAPAAVFLANCGLVGRAWNAALEDTLVSVIAEAAGKAERRVRLRLASLEAPGYSHNRRTHLADGTTRIGESGESEVRRRGPLDTTLSVLTAHDGMTDRPVAALVHFACHAVFYCDRLIGPDWPGRMIGTIRERMGSEFMAMFVQGACADVNPTLPGDSVDEGAKRMGDGLGEKALECITDMRMGAWLKARVYGGIRLVPLPWRSAPSEDELSKHLLSPTDWTVASRDAQARHLWANRVMRARTRGWWTGGIRMPVQVLSLGELAVVAVGAEVFTQTALDLRAARTEGPVVTVGYANDDVGYLPPPVEYQYGGYEIERAYRYYGYPDAFAPEAECSAREMAISMMQREGG